MGNPFNINGSYLIRESTNRKVEVDGAACSLLFLSVQNSGLDVNIVLNMRGEYSGSFEFQIVTTKLILHNGMQTRCNTRISNRAHYVFTSSPAQK